MEIKIIGIDAVQGYLAQMDAAKNRAIYRSINKVAAKTRTAGSKAIRKSVKLKAAYLNAPGRFVLTKANPKKFSAEITAQDRATRLATYGAKQLTAKAGPRAMGDPLRGIARGRKAAGVSVNVSGTRKKMAEAFMVPLKNGNGMGVFVRTGPGKNDIKHLYGPSVNQVFRTLMPEITKTTASDLQDAFLTQLAYERKA